MIPGNILITYINVARHQQSIRCNNVPDLVKPPNTNPGSAGGQSFSLVGVDNPGLLLAAEKPSLRSRPIQTSPITQTQNICQTHHDGHGQISISSHSWDVIPVGLKVVCPLSQKREERIVELGKYWCEG